MVVRLVLALLLVLDVSAQDRRALERLCSEQFAGRGYLNGGDSIAAEFIAEEFRGIGLQPVLQSYFQPFSFSVNTFPNDPIMKVDGKSLECGRSFIPDPACSKVDGVFNLFYFDHTILHSKKKLKKLNKIDFSDKVVVLDRKNFDPKKNKSSRSVEELVDLVKGGAFKNPATIVVEDKLTFGVAGFQTVPLFHSLRNEISSKDQKIQLKCDPVLKSEHLSRNVIGKIPGSTYPDSLLFVTAHYDHLGKIGQHTTFRGANDNASGILMLLHLAKRIKEKPLPFTVVFVAFAGEEAGLKGSDHFVTEPPVKLDHIRFLINLDIVGTGEDGAMVVNGTELKDDFSNLETLSKEKGFISLKPRGKAANSDHYYFYEAGVPSFFIYTLGGSKAYHDVHDVPENLSFAGFRGLSDLIYEYFSTFGR